jgi:hypothetical protein
MPTLLCHIVWMPSYADDKPVDGPEARRVGLCLRPDGQFRQPFPPSLTLPPDARIHRPLPKSLNVICWKIRQSRRQTTVSAPTSLCHNGETDRRC